MRTAAELCCYANSVLHNWRFEPLPDGTLRLRQYPHGGLQWPSLVGAVVCVGLAGTVRNAVYPDANGLLIGMFSLFAALLLGHGASTVEYVAGDNFLEQRRFFFGLRWRKRRLVGASLEVVRVAGDPERWRMGAVRKGVEIGSLVFGASQIQPIGELLGRVTGWKLDPPRREVAGAVPPGSHFPLASLPSLSVDADAESPPSFLDREQLEELRRKGDEEPTAPQAPPSPDEPEAESPDEPQ